MLYCRMALGHFAYRSAFMTENLVYAVQLKKWIIDNGYDLQAFRDLFALVSAEISGNPDFNHGLTFEITVSLKNWLAEYMQVSPEREIEECAKLMESCLLLEAPYLVDSYFQYIELDIPDPYKRFYLPRRRVLRPIIDAYQEVYDGKLDFLSVSQPKRTGKALRLSQRILTPAGTTAMGDLKAGDKVLSRNGDTATVLGVYPQGAKQLYRVTLDNGASAECCVEHIWHILHIGAHLWTEDCPTSAVMEYLSAGNDIAIPMINGTFSRVASIVGTHLEEAQCIEVDHPSKLYALENEILTHNTTSGLRLTTMMAGRKPDGNIFATGKGEGLVKSFFGGLNDIYETPEVYRRYLEVFPKAPKVKQNAEELTIDLATERRFSSITCRPIDGSVVGNTEANVLLYIDDCVKNHEEARNIARLEFLCEKITDDILGRRIEGCPIIIQGTKYSLHDPITMLQDKATQLGWRWKEVAIPALDPVTDQSNWTIYSPDRKPIFTTEYYQNERNLVTAETWAAEFQQEPYEAKGRMFPEEQLNRFTNLPVDMEPDTIIAACDTAGDGSDYCSMPIAYVYGQEVYIVDVVFDDSAPTFTKAECANKLVEHNVKRVTFESNSAGGYFGRDVMELVEANGGRCSARFKYSVANKLTRMENASDNIIKYYYFLDKTCYAAGSQYDTFLKNVVRMTRSGKVSHDDGPDSLALLENEMRNTPKPATVYRHVL